MDSQAGDTRQTAFGGAGAGPGVPQGESEPYTTRQAVGLAVGPLLFLAMLLIPAPAGMDPAAKRMASVATLMAIWWLCESIPIPATSLLPIPLFPMLGLLGTKATTAQYAGHLIFLFMGGFLIALAMQRWNLHRRMAMHIIRIVGFSPRRLILGFMVATALLSAFVSNTATAAMMMPIGLAIIVHVTDAFRREGRADQQEITCTCRVFGLNLMLGIAYAASIGGVATLIGTPPNTVLAGFLNEAYGYEITFARWMVVGVPLAAILLPLCWLWLVRVANPMSLGRVPGGRNLIESEIRMLGPMGPGERWTALVFGTTALAWVFAGTVRSVFPVPTMVTDAAIGMAGGLLLFLIPVDLKRNVFVLDWDWASRMPWGVLILFGGGLALAEGFQQTGLAAWIGNQVTLLGQAPVLVLVAGVILLIIFLTEMTSNTATAAMVMPILAAVAIGLNQDPLLLLIPAAIAASCAFMLPVATPPNAIVFGSGYVSIPDMARAGVGLNLMASAVILGLTYLVVIPLFHIVLGQAPAWLP